jgi:hypothetical protein
MSSNKEEKLVTIPMYSYGSFKVCALCPLESVEMENKSSAEGRHMSKPRVNIVSLKKPKYVNTSILR